MERYQKQVEVFNSNLSNSFIGWLTDDGVYAFGVTTTWDEIKKLRLILKEVD